MTRARAGALTVLGSSVFFNERRHLAELAAKGAAVVLISSELEEIIGMCDRVVVMREGRIAGELEGNHVEEREIMYMATGLRTGANA